MREITRRGFLSASAAGAAAWPFIGSFDQVRAVATSNGSRDLELLDLDVEGDASIAKRFTLLFPRGLSGGTRVPLVVLLHGLGETGDPRAGAYAWIERYGLLSSYARLAAPPISRTSMRADWSDDRLDAVNADLAKRPFGGLAFACPVTPNVNKMRDPSAALDAYAAWIVDVVIPRARKAAPVLADAAHTHLDGCSLGGFIGLEVFLRRPDAFGAWGGVQSAFGPQRAAAYAERLAALVKHTPKKLHIETSDGDPFREANTRLSTELTRRGVAHGLRVLPGPHDQPWLRESGTIEMLLFHDRV